MRQSNFTVSRINVFCIWSSIGSTNKFLCEINKSTVVVYTDTWETIGMFQHGCIFHNHTLLIEITQTGLKLVVLDFGFVCDDLVRHWLCSDMFGAQYFIVSTFSVVIIPCSFVQHILYSSHWRIYFVITIHDLTILCSNKIVRVFILT